MFVSLLKRAYAISTPARPPIRPSLPNISSTTPLLMPSLATPYLIRPHDPPQPLKHESHVVPQSRSPTPHTNPTPRTQSHLHASRETRQPRPRSDDLIPPGGFRKRETLLRFHRTPRVLNNQQANMISIACDRKEQTQGGDNQHSTDERTMDRCIRARENLLRFLKTPRALTIFCMQFNSRDEPSNISASTAVIQYLHSSSRSMTSKDFPCALSNGFDM